MAYQRKHRLQSAFEFVLAHPLRASLIVGGVINLVQLGLLWLGNHVPINMLYLSMLVPFIPPYVASHTSRKVHERAGEHDFVRDALSYVFVAHPANLTHECLATCKPYMLSHGASKATGLPIETMLNTPVLAGRFFENVHTQAKIIQYFITEYQQHGRAEVHDHMVTFVFGETPEHYILNSVLKPYREGLKWQGVLVRYEPERDPQPLKAFH